MLKVLPEELNDENALPHLSLDEIARLGAKKLLREALELEVEEYVNNFKSLRDPDGKRLVVRNGKSKPRNITMGSGTVDVQAPRVNDRREGQKYTSQILPPYLRKSPKVESVLPILYLKGLSGNAFNEALEGLLGENASGLSKSSISALKKSWEKELGSWKQREINEKFVYLWADGVYVKVRLGEDKKVCLLVVVGVTDKGEKKLLAVEGGFRESKDSWKCIFNSLVSRGLNAPMVMIGDGALGLWSAIREVPEFKDTKEQRCWVHKIANVLNHFPDRLKPKVKSMLHDMMKAESESMAIKGKKEFEKNFHEKYPKAVECLMKDWDKVTTYFSFPASHWQSIRTSNPIESAFATVKLRTKTTKGAGSTAMAEAMAFKLLTEAEKKWRKIKGFKKIEKLLGGGVYKDGILVEKDGDQEAVA